MSGEKDSVFIREKGDTIYVDRYKYLYRDRFLRDTVTIMDSVSYPVYVEVVKKARYVPRFFRWCFAAAIVVIGWTVRKWLWKVKRP